jgi:hypothetical protein
VRSLRLPDCWVGAGFVRTAVWDALAGRPSRMMGDVDVIWLDARRACPLRDILLQQRLAAAHPRFAWSVKNQGRMHLRNADAPYPSCFAALQGWPETATAVAVRLNDRDAIDILAPFGLQDLFGGVIRPTPRFLGGKMTVFERRYAEKNWLNEWPFLKVLNS